MKHILAPVYHGDPLNSDGCLVYWDFGNDLIRRLDELGINACESVSSRFYPLSEISDMNNSEQYKRYQFMRKRKQRLSRALHYNAITYVAEAVNHAPAPYRVQYTPETDSLQIYDLSVFDRVCEGTGSLAVIRSETVNWGGQTVQMLDLTIKQQEETQAIILLVKLVFGECTTLVFPERFRPAHRFIDSLAVQTHVFLMKLLEKYGEIPDEFYMDVQGVPVSPPEVSERNMPGENRYYTVVPHLRRYNFVADNLDTSVKKVLDMGCGLGYGLNMLNPHEGMGLDISEEALQWASTAFPQRSLSWVQSPIEEARFDTEFDAISSFEVLEHLPDHLQYMKAAAEWLHPEGAFFISVPNPLYRGKATNHYHLRDYGLEAIKALFSRYFEEVEWFHQDDDSSDLQRRFLVKPGVLPGHHFWLAKCKKPVKKQLPAKVSIIMPLHNNWEFSHRAVETLSANTPRLLNWELILIDDGSTDRTVAELNSLSVEAIRYRNPESLGFAKACNQAALLACGDTLVFLSSGTEVRQGWLEALLDELNSHPDTGVAGGKLLYPDGSIQHAGMAIGRDLIPFHIHRGLDAGDPLVNERRAFPAITAACTAVRRREFLDLDGFDEAFVNGHEDIDLCVRYRRQGKVCVYRPDCTVVHHESVSDGRMNNRKQNLARTLQKSRYDLVQDDFVYSMRADAIARPGQKLRFAIKIGVPQREVSGWGDIYYAECLARALVRAGHDCVIHYLSEWGGEDADIDVVIHLKGLSEYYPKPWNYNIMWMLNHPELHTKEELERYDAVFVASLPHARTLQKELAIPVLPLLQATDPEHFAPCPDAEKMYDLVFVGNNNGVGRLGMRGMVRNLLPTRHSLAVYGKGWDGLLPPGVLKGEFVPWEKLPEIYSSSRIVINDHQPSMASYGFISNRTYDALACGAVVLSDPVKESSSILDVPQCGTRQSLHEAVDAILDDPAQARQKFLALREKVLNKHTFTHRAAFIEAFVRDSRNKKEVWDRISSARRTAADPERRRTGPRVSILMATCNRRPFLRNALLSIINQTYTDWEVLLVNDGGVRVDDIIAELGDPRIRLVSPDQKRGKGHAINLAFKKSRGTYIAYNDDEDVWLPDHLERLMLAIREVPGVSLVYSDAALVDLSSNARGARAGGEYRMLYQGQVTLSDMLEWNQINESNVLHRRDLFLLAGKFDEHLAIQVHYDMWRRLVALAYPYHVSRITAERHAGTGNGSMERLALLARDDSLAYRKQRLRIVRKQLALPKGSPFEAPLQQLRERHLFAYFVALCQKSMSKGERRKSARALLLAERHKTFSLEGLRGLALCYMEHQKYEEALQIFSEYADSPGVELQDYFFALFAALEQQSLENAVKYAGRIGKQKHRLAAEALELFGEYGKKLERLKRRKAGLPMKNSRAVLSEQPRPEA